MPAWARAWAEAAESARWLAELGQTLLRRWVVNPTVTAHPARLAHFQCLVADSPVKSGENRGPIRGYDR